MRFTADNLRALNIEFELISCGHDDATVRNGPREPILPLFRVYRKSLFLINVCLAILFEKLSNDPKDSSINSPCNWDEAH